MYHGPFSPTMSGGRSRSASRSRAAARALARAQQGGQGASIITDTPPTPSFM
jgi:hypothetical protein